MVNLQIVIGIEVHVSLNTKSKMFSNSFNSHTNPPNTLVNEVDLAFPGTLPTVNKAAVEKAIILADALKMEINYKNIQFDRKNYFYIDLPKSFQITQQYFPIGTNGKISISSKEIEIERIHIEEDTAKQLIKNNKKYLDYNRCGSPLIEIVTTPCISSASEAMDYLNELRHILIFKNISDAKMEEGSMRCDVNISLMPFGCSTFGTKVEIKNINSINNVGKAIEFEIKRQNALILSNVDVQQETRRFDDSENVTHFMRVKGNAIDYRFITESNILSFKYSTKKVEELIRFSNPLPNVIIEKERQNNLNEKQLALILENFPLYELYAKINKIINNPKLVFNYIFEELTGAIKKNKIKLKDLSDLQLSNIEKLLNLLNNQEINSKQGKSLLQEIFNYELTISQLINKFNYIQIKDPNIISEIAKRYIENNQKLMNEYPNRPERVEKFLIGMIMKETNSQANPIISNKIVVELLAKFK